MPLKRRKNSAPNPLCPLSSCMALIGGTWTPNAIWYLSGGPRRFSELKADMKPVSAKVLTQRLREMEENGIITRRVVPTSPPSVEYELTELGGELLPAIRAIADVGMKLKQKNGKNAA
ncbi:helix-turn-helix transcriptional regulator [Defluviimonas sp. WL0050]|uniref:Helix-turn-helix transcriptional regulator n=1 Tax=Albidovulum litorale TaxID=2984134 RepID=A0ABT2ZPU1_9RHOB|nr:helix-turn-helix domain-containing protein [Defluviimonas sp. WL0050]MCV2873161.1 helix-turn-helix transcriptional regulator [Defluviimonas sp. WL0050]